MIKAFPHDTIFIQERVLKYEQGDVNLKNYVQIINQLLDEKIVAILRVDHPEKAKKGIAAMKKGGLKNIEVTLNTPGALDVISAYSNDEDMMIGAGTVLDEAACQAAIQHGANYIVTPTLNESVIKCANRYQKPVICGCFTPTEMQQAMELGVNMIKAFPASEMSYDAISAIKGPLHYALIGPTGGVTLSNIKIWEEAGADFYGIAGEFCTLTNQEKYDELEEVAARYVDALRR
ncbi:hypothetical protein I585_01345 [Enterococcus malodoratus ATCC 43197]|uniref:2-dehydro-3-deoxyphosphogluconate aldolase/4-hydroxy-2-oxoglutarate aldolase n=1 Tax=Enterococcus malodoratus ATCC 43197 TaxID=1158601 RepID=A0ABN0LSP3_9ENTE|nr:hypothetical protein I585_01345 [Enterococcus malodoratus ATCC 43197]